MAFRIHLLFICISLCLLLPYDANARKLESPEAKVSMETKTFGIWVSVPCEHDVGSCSYNVCTNTTLIYPDIFGNYNVERKCPSIPPAIYSVSNLIVTITKSVPSIVQGDFRMDTNFDSSYAGHIGCLHIDANLKM